MVEKAWQEARKAGQQKQEAGWPHFYPHLKGRWVGGGEDRKGSEHSQGLSQGGISSSKSPPPKLFQTGDKVFNYTNPLNHHNTLRPLPIDKYKEQAFLCWRFITAVQTCMTQQFKRRRFYFGTQFSEKHRCHSWKLWWLAIRHLQSGTKRVLVEYLLHCEDMSLPRCQGP